MSPPERELKKRSSGGQALAGGGVSGHALFDRKCCDTFQKASNFSLSLACELFEGVNDLVGHGVL